MERKSRLLYTFLKVLPSLELWRQLTAKERTGFKGTRWLLLKNPWNLNDNQKERLSTLVRWNTPLVRAWYLKEVFQLFWNYKQPPP